MKSTHIVIACQQCGGRATVPAFTEADVVGLAINKMHVHGRAGKLAEQSWVVSHVASGQVMGAGYVEQAQAEHALRQFGALPVDWTLPADDPRFRDPALIAVMVDIVEEAQGLDTGLPL